MSKPISPKQAGTLCRLFGATEATIRRHLGLHDKASPIIGAAKAGNVQALARALSAAGVPDEAPFAREGLGAKVAAYLKKEPAPTPDAQPEQAEQPETPEPEAVPSPDAQPAPGGERALEFLEAIQPMIDQIMGVADLLADKAQNRIGAALKDIGVIGVSAIESAKAAAVPAPVPGGVPLPAPQPGYFRPSWFPNLAAAVRARLNVILSGPAGTGKSRAAREIANDIGLPCFVTDCRAGMTRADFFYCRSIAGGDTAWELAPFLSHVQEPGVSCLNEPFALDPETLLGFNALLEEREMETPLGLIKVHDEHVFVLAANIAGRSESRTYRGAQAQDASVLSRCVSIRTVYDPLVEGNIAAAYLPKADAKALCQAVQDMRAALDRAQIAHDVTPRVYKQIAGLVGQGLTLQEAARLVLMGPLEPSEVAKIQSSVSLLH